MPALSFLVCSCNSQRSGLLVIRNLAMRALLSRPPYWRLSAKRKDGRWICATAFSDTTISLINPFQ